MTDGNKNANCIKLSFGNRTISVFCYRSAVTIVTEEIKRPEV